jgi:hypothetical protein
MSNEEQYDLEELKRFWKLDYEQLAMAPGQPGARLREARFILQVRVALEARRLAVVMAIATVAMTIATIAMAIAAFSRR